MLVPSNNTIAPPAPSPSQTKHKQVRVLGEAYTPDDEEDSAAATVGGVYAYQARYRVPLNKAVAGNWVLLEGVDATSEQRCAACAAASRTPAPACVPSYGRGRQTPDTFLLFWLRLSRNHSASPGLSSTQPALLVLLRTCPFPSLAIRPWSHLAPWSLRLPLVDA